MMNRILDFYFELPHDKSLGIFSKAFNRMSARILKRVLDRTVPPYFLRTMDQFPSGINQQPRDKKIIVSLTSFPARIEDLWIVIECLFRQSYQADKIILWLARPQFEGIDLPQSLVIQQKRGLEIRFVDEDLRSHKKYYYALKEYKTELVITVDDDVFYHKDTIKELKKYYDFFPYCVIANRGHLIKAKAQSDEISPYRKWQHNAKNLEPSYLLVPTGVGGVLYPPGSLSQEVYNKEVFLKLCPMADDLWLKVSSLLNSKKVFITPRYKQEFITVGKTQKNKLVTSNSLNGGNDQQLRAVLDHFQLGNLEKFRDQN